MGRITFDVQIPVSIELKDKAVHLIGAVVTAGLGIGIVIWQPDLLKDAPTTLGTLGTFATAYGVLFAIVELRRAKSASLHAREEAERVFRAMTSLATAREIVECQTTIQIAIGSLDDGRLIPSSVLCQIVKLYSQVFFAQLADEISSHRRNRSVIESYAHNPNIPASNGPSKNTRRALLSIASQLGELQGSTKNFTEYVK